MCIGFLRTWSWESEWPWQPWPWSENARLIRRSEDARMQDCKNARMSIVRGIAVCGLPIPSPNCTILTWYLDLFLWLRNTYQPWYGGWLSQGWSPTITRMVEYGGVGDAHRTDLALACLLNCMLTFLKWWWWFSSFEKWVTIQRMGTTRSNLRQGLSLS